MYCRSRATPTETTVEIKKRLTGLVFRAEVRTRSKIDWRRLARLEATVVIGLLRSGALDSWAVCEVKLATEVSTVYLAGLLAAELPLVIASLGPTVFLVKRVACK